MTDEPKDPLEELHDAFAKANEQIREQFRDMPPIRLLPEALAKELIRAGFAYEPEAATSITDQRTLRFDTMKFNEEQRVFEVDGGPEPTHAVLRGHPLAFQAFREQVIEEVLAAACRCSFDGLTWPEEYMRRMILQELEHGGDDAQS